MLFHVYLTIVDCEKAFDIMAGPVQVKLVLVEFKVHQNINSIIRSICGN